MRLVVAMILFCSIIAAGAHATTAVDSDLQVTATAWKEAASDFDSAEATWGPLAPLSVSAQASVSGAHAEGTYSASWASASSGSLIVDLTYGVNSADLANTLIGGTGWTYSFIPDANGFFELDYSAHAWLDGEPIPSSFSIVFDGVHHGVGGTGSFEHSIESGTTHTVRVNYGVGSSGFDHEFQTSGTFDWHILPEPSSTAVVLIGIPLIGLLRPRR